MRMQDVVAMAADAPLAPKEADAMMDAWLDGFIKECEDRGVDPERFLAILIKGQEVQDVKAVH